MSDLPVMPARDAYAHWADIYDSNDNATRDADAALLRAQDLPLDGAQVVEFGAGTGKNTAYLAEHAAQVTALDFSPAMLEKARARVTSAHVTFIEHNITQRWPLEDGSADVIVGNLVLEHIHDLTTVMAQIRRVLRAGGVAWICELHPFRQLAGAQAKFETAQGTQMVEAYVHSVSEYVNTALAAGLSLENMVEHSDADGRPRLLGLRLRG